MLTVEARAMGRRRRQLIPDWGFPLPPEWDGTDGLTLRELISRVVREEVAAFQERQNEGQFLRVLTEKQITEGVSTGRVVSGGRSLRQRVDVDAAIGAAWMAFEDGLYLVLIDEQQYEDLDEPVWLRLDSTVTFLRLVALAGG